MLLRDREAPSEAGTKASWLSLLRYRQTWGAVAARALTDPVWYFIADWFAIYLTSRGFRLEQSLMAFWIPFLCADLGNYAGGAASSWLVHRGWPVGRARRAIVVPGGLGMLALIPAAYSTSLGAISLFFGLATFSYAAFSTIANTLPADLFDTRHVASVSGITGAAAGLGTILSTYAIGYFADHLGFQPVVAAASAVPIVAMALVLLLVRNTSASGKGTILHV
jgi:ACS family hexuronate transporter-like MFS transporter